MYLSRYPVWTSLRCTPTLWSFHRFNGSWSVTTPFERDRAGWEASWRRGNHGAHRNVNYQSAQQELQPLSSKGVFTEYIRSSGGVQRSPQRFSNRKTTTTHLLLGPTFGYSYHHSYAENPTALYYSIKEPELLAHFDKLYQLLHYIPNRETFLLNYTAVILAQ